MSDLLRGMCKGVDGSDEREKMMVARCPFCHAAHQWSSDIDPWEPQLSRHDRKVREDERRRIADAVGELEAYTFAFAGYDVDVFLSSADVLAAIKVDE